MGTRRRFGSLPLLSISVAIVLKTVAGQSIDVVVDNECVAGSFFDTSMYGCTTCSDYFNPRAL